MLYFKEYISNSLSNVYCFLWNHKTIFFSNYSFNNVNCELLKGKVHVSSHNFASPNSFYIMCIEVWFTSMNFSLFSDIYFLTMKGENILFFTVSSSTTKLKSEYHPFRNQPASPQKTQVQEFWV